MFRSKQSGEHCQGEEPLIGRVMVFDRFVRTKTGWQDNGGGKILNRPWPLQDDEF